MSYLNWRKVNRIFAFDTHQHHHQDEKVFKKSNTLDLISKLDLSVTHQPGGRKQGFTSIASQSLQPSEAIRALRPFLNYFKLFGFLPLTINKGNTGVWINKRNAFGWIFTLISLLIQSVMTVRAVRELIQALSSSGDGSSASDEVSSANGIVYYVHTLSMTLIMLHRLHMLPNFLESCKRVEQLCLKYQTQNSPNKNKSNNDNLVKHCWLVFAYFVCTQLIGNVLYYYSQVERYNVTSISGFSDIYELAEEKSLKSPFPGVPYSLLELYCDVGWTFGDTLIALMSLILTRFFTRLNKGISDSKAETVEEVEGLRKDHRTIKDLVEQCNQVFSPIILVNFMGNVIYLLTRLYLGLADDLRNPKLIVRIESIYAFVYQVSKILLPTWLAAILNETAAEAIDTVHDWPSLIDMTETRSRMLVISRFISQLINDPVGLSGCGYFSISKSFLVTVISAILTYEIVILQFQQSGL